jgi:autotransporter-associated beta strand protein
MIRALLTLLFCLSVGLVFGQMAGDYRSDQNGNWGSATTWQVFFNGDWRLLETAAAGPFQNVIPSSASGVITIRNGVIVNLNTTANQIVIDNILTVQSTRTLIVQGDGANTPLQINASGQLVNNGTLDLQTQIGTVPCQVLGTMSSNGTILASNPSLIIFQAASTYVHFHSNGGRVPSATWNINSTCRISGLTTGNAVAPANLAQAFGNFEFNALNAGYSPAFHLGGTLSNVRGNLTIISTGANTLRFRSGQTGLNLTVGGNFIVQGGSVILAQNLSSASTITVGGNLVISGGTLRLGAANSTPINFFLNGNFGKTGGTFLRGSGSGAGAIRFNGGIQSYTNNSNIPDAVHFSVQNGSTLDLGTSFLTGTGSFTVAAGGTVNLGSLDAGGAVQLGTGGGNIRVNGTRTYQTGSTFVYNGAGPQFMGTGHPANANTTINNVNDVVMVGNATINGVLNVVNGFLLIEANTLTLGGTYLTTGGTIAASTASNIAITGTGDFSDLIISFSQFPNNPINNLTINRPGGTVFLGNDLIVAGTLTQTAGNFSLGQFNPFTLTVRGPFVQTAGSFLVFNSSSLVIDGAGALPADVNIIGPNMGTLTMDRTGGTFISTSPLTLTNLNLFSGTVNNSTFNITMAPNGIVTRRSGGSLVQVLGVGAPNSFDVVYDVATDITTGPELPFTSPVTTRLGNLTKTGAGTVDLNHDIVVNGTFTISQGIFDVGVNNDVTINRNLTVDGALDTREGLMVFGGNSDQTISGLSSISFYDVEVNQTSPSAVDIATPVSIVNSLTVTSGSVVNAGNQLLTLVSDATRTANVAPLGVGASIGGTVNVQRFLPKAVQRAEYYHMATPVTNSTFADWRDDVPIASVKRWNEPTRAYVNAPANPTNGVGYVVDVTTPSTATVETSGTLAQGNVSVNITTRTPGNVASDDGWNLIGNPYPSAIDWDNVAINETQVYNAIYMWDNFGNSGQGSGIGILVSYVDGVGTPASFGGEIAQGQAFWVKALQNSSIAFTESAKTPVTNTTLYRKNEVPNVLRIAINGAGVNDETVIRLREGATEKFDGKYDAYKYLKSDFNISTLTSDNIKAVINAFGASSCNRAIPLVAEGAKTGNFTLNFAGIESFDPAVTLSLVDKLEQKSVDIRGQQAYAFTITDENLGTISSRFEISIGSHATSINNAIAAKGESLCEDQDIARITLESSEPGIEYMVDLNGNKLSDPVKGTGSSIELIVRTSSLIVGENQVTVIAQSGICSMTTLANKPVITRFKRGEVSNVTQGDICIAGFTTLRASGADDKGWYLWYNASDDTEPIAGQNSAEFVTPYLTKSKTYYVSVVNTLGCQGAKMPVQAVVSYPEDVNLSTSNEGILVSSVTGGNQWYLNGQLLEGHTFNTLEPFESGLYTVEVQKGNCITSASLEVTGLGEGDITIFPNPTPDKVVIRMNTTNNNVIATLVSSQGVEMDRMELAGAGGSKQAEFDLLPFAAGIYHVRILDGQKVTNKKIAKIK